MLNNITLVGRINEVIKKSENEVEIGLNIERPYKNEDGEYDIDTIHCVVEGKIVEQINLNCDIGDVIGIKGSLREIKVGNASTVIVIADKVSFLAKAKTND